MFPRVAIIVAVMFVTLYALFIVPGWLSPFRLWRAQMRAGSAYMKSLRESDVPPWIERTKLLLAEWNPRLHPIGAYGLGGKPIPADLQQLKIIRIDILEDQVR